MSVGRTTQQPARNIRVIDSYTAPDLVTRDYVIIRESAALQLMVWDARRSASGCITIPVLNCNDRCILRAFGSNGKRTAADFAPVYERLTLGVEGKEQAQD